MQEATEQHKKMESQFRRISEMESFYRDLHIKNRLVPGNRLFS